MCERRKQSEGLMKKAERDCEAALLIVAVALEFLVESCDQGEWEQFYAMATKQEV